MQAGRTVSSRDRIGTALLTFAIASVVSLLSAANTPGFTLTGEFVLIVGCGVFLGVLIGRIEVAAAEKFPAHVRQVTDFATITSYCVFMLAAPLLWWQILHDGWSIFGVWIGATGGRAIQLWRSLAARSPSRT